MDYSKWTSKSGAVFSISNMSIKYIRNCIAMIVRSVNPTVERNGGDVFDEVWMVLHGKQYLNAFYDELARRNCEVL